MKFTTSRDGKERANVKLVVRLDHDQLDLLTRIAKKRKMILIDMLESEAGLAVEDLMSRAVCDGEFGEL